MDRTPRVNRTENATVNQLRGNLVGRRFLFLESSRTECKLNRVGWGGLWLVLLCWEAWPQHIPGADAQRAVMVPVRF